MKVITSFSPDGYNLYGKRFLETYTEHHDIPIVVYHEDSEPDFAHPLVSYKNLFKTEGCTEFLSRCDFPAMQGNLWGEGKRNYRFDVFKFARKSFAQIDAASSHDDWLYWLDADVEFSAPIEFPEIEDTFMLYLGRPEWHSCASFVGWNLRHPIAGEFFKRYWLLHVTGTIFCLPEWHDSFVLDWLREATGCPAINLSQHIEGLEGPANVFDKVFPSARHKKGNLKTVTNRYKELFDLVQKLKPKRVLEIGTWKGIRAVDLCNHGATYTGFDLFEDASDETDAAEKNVKQHYSVEDVSKYLDAAGVKHTLVKGNTRDTLPGYEGEFDFAFIDGGHSIETIRSDWENIKPMMVPGGVVVFDDYYEGTPTDEYGANEVVKDLEYTLSKAADPIVGGGVTRLAIVEL